MNIYIGMLQFIFPLFITYFVISRILSINIFKGNFSAFGRILLIVSLSIPVGLACSSYLYFLWCLLFNPLTKPFFVFELCFYLTLIFITLRFTEPTSSKKLNFNLDYSLLPFILLFVLFLLIRSNDFLNLSVLMPYGNWDAYAIWNLKARFIFRGDSYWWNIFSPIVSTSHGDYPLFLPLSIARGWYYLGTDSKIIPLLIQSLLSFSMVFSILSFTSLVRDWKTAFLFSAAFLYSSGISDTAVSQYADLPLASFFVAVLCIFGLIVSGIIKATPDVYLLMAFCAGSATWIKNEGIPFFGIFLIYCLIFSYIKKYLNKKILFGFALGCLLPILFLVIFKFISATSNDVIGGKGWFENFFIFSRYEQIWEALNKELSFEYFIFLFLIALTLCFGKPNTLSDFKLRMSIILIPLLQLTVYLLIYIMTPHDLKWHLDSSLSRLIFQLYGMSIIGLVAILPGQESVTKNRV